MAAQVAAVVVAEIIAANGGLSYMSFDQDGDAGTAAATEAALQQIATGWQ